MGEASRLEALDRLLELSLALEADMRAGLERVGLTPARAGVVWTLGEAGPRTQRELATVLGVSPRNVTGLVDGLVDAGFVTREPHPTDRRAIHVTLTEVGETTAAGLVAGRVELAGQLFGDLDPAALRTFAETLGTVTDRIRRLIAEGG